MDSEEKQRAAVLIREVASLQIKLLIDALRDLVLSPITLGAAVLDLLLVSRQPPRYFHEALKLGKQSDQWIDLWAPVEERDGMAPENADALMARVEALVRDPATSARQARVLRRWVEMTLARQRRGKPPGGDLMAAPPAAMPPPPPAAKPPPPGGDQRQP